MIYEYKRSLKNISGTFLVLSLFLFIILRPNENLQIMYSFGIWVIFFVIPFVLYFFVIKRIICIRIDDEKKYLFLEYKKYFNYKTFKTKYLLSDIQFSYKEKTGARLTKYMELEFLYKNESLLNFRSADGWDESIMIQIVKNLKDLQVKEK